MNVCNQKKVIYERYQKELKGMPGLSFMKEGQNTLHNRWLSTLLIEPNHYFCTPEEIVVELEKENIELRPLWKPLHLQPLFQNNRFYAYSEETMYFGRTLSNRYLSPIRYWYDRI